MPGPKMGPRPHDFDEDLVRRSPTFRKWEALLPGTRLRYACRDFVKGQGDDEERLMRRIMIARRNNVRDHQALKWARRMQSSTKEKRTVAPTEESLAPAGNNGKEKRSSLQVQIDPVTSTRDANGETMVNNDGSHEEEEKYIIRNNNISNSRVETEAIISRTSRLLQQELEATPGRRSRRPTTLVSDDVIREEMDVSAVEATRSYKTWLSLPNGAEFLYNQKYTKGHEAHDWLLRKNIWRRMRYRRENKKMVYDMICQERVGIGPSITQQQQHASRKRKLNITSTADGNGIVNNDHRHVGGVVDRLTDTSSSSRILGLDGSTNETNRQEVAASTASEIVDHALLSTNTGVVATVASESDARASDAITISIGDQQQHQQLQTPHPLHHHHHHHHDPNESAAAFAASIALAAGSVVDVNGIGIGTDGDHQVADSAAVEAAVAAALAATDAKSNSYHHHAAGNLVDVNHVVVVHGTDVPTDRAGGIPGVHLSSTASAAATGVSATHNSSTTGSGTNATPEVVGLGLALDAAAKLAAAAAASTSTSEEAVLAATTVMTASTNTPSDLGHDSSEVRLKKGGGEEGFQATIIL